MRKFIGAASALALLSGCAAAGLTGNPANDVPIIATDVLTITNGACADYAPFGAAAMLAPDPKVQTIAAMVGGVCDIATGKVLPSATVKVDPTTAQWIAASGGMINALLSAKSVTLPVAPPAAAPAKAS